MCFLKFTGIFIYISQLQIVTCHAKARNARTNPGIPLEKGSICQEGTKSETKRSNVLSLGNIDKPPYCNKNDVSPKDSKGNHVTLLGDTRVIPGNFKRRHTFPTKRGRINQGCLEEKDKAGLKVLGAVRPGRAIRSGAPSLVDAVLAQSGSTGRNDLLQEESSAVGDGNTIKGTRYRSVSFDNSFSFGGIAQSDGSLEEEAGVDPKKITCKRVATSLHEQNTLL